MILDAGDYGLSARGDYGPLTSSRPLLSGKAGHMPSPAGRRAVDANRLSTMNSTFVAAPPVWTRQTDADKMTLRQWTGEPTRIGNGPLRLTNGHAPRRRGVQLDNVRPPPVGMGNGCHSTEENGSFRSQQLQGKNPNNGIVNVNSYRVPDRPTYPSSSGGLVTGSNKPAIVSAPHKETKPRRPLAIRAAKSENNLKQEMAAVKNSGLLNDDEQFQIELMYSCRASRVVVCGCLANLFFANKRFHYNGRSSPTKDDWQLAATGVPILLLDLGESRVRRVRQLQVVLAEKGTGFTLWKDSLDNLSQYTEIGRSFHTMLLSTNHQKFAGLSFDNSYSAMKFYQQVRDLTSKPENVSLSKSSSNLKKSTSKSEGLNVRLRRHSLSGAAKKLLRKSEISNPCCFTHITSLKPRDLDSELQPQRAQSCLQIGLLTASTHAINSPASSV